MVDKAIVIESKLKEMEKDDKRKMQFPRQSSGSLDLIVLYSKSIDIILAMDWLRKYDRVILCAKRAG
jgi:hypothetical protein